MDHALREPGSCSLGRFAQRRLRIGSLLEALTALDDRFERRRCFEEQAVVTNSPDKPSCRHVARPHRPRPAACHISYQVVNATDLSLPASVVKRTRAG
jgi:hypothetical protein